MQFGAYTFVETRRDPVRGEPVDVDKAFANVLEQIELADRVGLDVFGLGEHHRPDYAVSAPAVALAAAAARTKRTRLTSAVTVLSSDDPVRVYQQFATLDLISVGRAEIMAGRGSFIESFPLFGLNLNDYDELFAEKLDLLLQICAKPQVTWQGRHRPALNGQGVYPRALQQPLPVWIASGGTPQSVARAARSACRWRSRSSAASRRGSGRWRTSTGRLAAAPASRPISSWSGSTAMASSPTRRKPLRMHSSRLTPR
jgi:alkanesulfonate monooxygenase SsuD/methylene tetrahydromethanopterin reductase-like flavin-dependent oxidoreductase (luciferase family)